MAGAVIAFLGPPGAGKSEQAKRLSAARGMAYVSTGQLLRDSPDPAIQEMMQTGALVPTQQVDAILHAYLAQLPADKGVVVDGFPRMPAEADWLRDNLKSHGRELVDVVFLDVPRPEAEARMLARGRHDDTKEAIDRRYDAYHAQTQPVENIYRQAGLLREVNGLGSREEVEARIGAAL